MTGCRVGAKNSLDRNYLWLAERLGVEIRAERGATAATSRRRLGARVRTAGRVDAAAARGRAGRPGRPGRRRARHGTAPAPLAPPGDLPASRRRRPHELGGDRRRGRAEAGRARRGSRSRPRSGRTTRPLSSPCATAQARTPWACSGRSSSTAAQGAAAAPLRGRGGPAPGRLRAQPLRPSLVGADADPARDAGLRQPAAADLRRGRLRSSGYIPAYLPHANAAARHAAAVLGGQPGSSLNEVLLSGRRRRTSSAAASSAPRPTSASSIGTTAFSDSRASTSSTARLSRRTSGRTRR